MNGHFFVVGSPRLLHSLSSLFFFIKQLVETWINFVYIIHWCLLCIQWIFFVCNLWCIVNVFFLVYVRINSTLSHLFTHSFGQIWVVISIVCELFCIDNSHYFFKQIYFYFFFRIRICNFIFELLFLSNNPIYFTPTWISKIKYFSLNFTIISLYTKSNTIISNRNKIFSSVAPSRSKAKSQLN